MPWYWWLLTYWLLGLGCSLWGWAASGKPFKALEVLCLPAVALFWPVFTVAGYVKAFEEVQ